MTYLPTINMAILEGDNKLPVIIAKDLSVLEKAALIKVLASHKRASLGNSPISRHIQRSYDGNLPRHESKKRWKLFMDGFCFWKFFILYMPNPFRKDANWSEDTNLALYCEKSHFHG
ncbi:hypothetical protein Tco_0588109 [Tanacetum coccineum]